MNTDINDLPDWAKKMVQNKKNEPDKNKFVEWGKLGGRPQKENKKSEKGFLEQLTLEEELVYRFCCTENEVTSEEILQQSGLSVVKLTMLLLQLQLKGYIREVGSGRYIVTRKD